MSAISLRSLAPPRTLPTIASRKLTRLAETIVETTTLSSQGICVISGAGLSTSSGIPDYRGPFGSYKRGHKPMTHQEFVSSKKKRARYWSRSFVGYNFFGAAERNEAHAALMNMGNMKIGNAPLIHAQITQNVDGLLCPHGDEKHNWQLVELHGNIHYADCQTCGRIRTRAALQEEMMEKNPQFSRKVHDLIFKKEGDGRLTADGDFDLSDFQQESEGNNKPFELEDVFVSPECNQMCGESNCEGVLKPSVVFFGGSVEQDVVQQCKDIIHNSSMIMVVGSSLQVWSAYRFVKLAKELEKPIAIINCGPTRADDFADIIIDCNVTESLPLLVERIKHSSR